MTNAPASPEVCAADAFDAALVRARAADGEPLPVLARTDPAKAPKRMVAELRGMLSHRFAHAVPAADAAALHRHTLRALGRMENRLRRRRIRTVVAHILRTYGWILLGLAAVAVLVGMAIVHFDAILTFVDGLRTSAPAPAPAAGSPAPPGAPAPAGTVP